VTGRGADTNAPQTLAGDLRFAASLARRDLLRVLRRPGQVIATVLTPVLVWGLFAGGPGGRLADASGETSVAAEPGIASGSGYYLVGAGLLVIAMASVFSSISLIEDREEGVLRSLVISPAARWAIAGGKFVSAAVLGAVQAAPLLIAAVATAAGAGGEVSAAGLAGVIGATIGVSMGVMGLCLAAAARSGSIRSFHGLVNLVLMPAWALSGALFPAEGSAGWIGVAAAVNPLAWGHGVIAWGSGVTAGDPPLWSGVGVVVFAVVGAVAAIGSVGRVGPRASGV